MSEETMQQKFMKRAEGVAIIPIPVPKVKRYIKELQAYMRTQGLTEGEKSDIINEVVFWKDIVETMSKITNI
jgi:hypothetical protein